MPWADSTPISSPLGAPPDDEAKESLASETWGQAPSSDAAVLFSGDRGLLPAETRRLFVHLLLGPYFDGRREPKQWLVLLRDEAVLRSRLHELFLELVVAHNEKVAFVRQVVAEELDAPILLRRLTLTFVETALLLFLRQRLTQADVQGERAVVSREELMEHLAVYERERNPDQARYANRCKAAIDKAANSLNLLRKLRSSGERYEISPTLKLLFPAEEILALLRTYRELQAEHEQDGGSEDVVAQSRDDAPDDAQDSDAAAEQAIAREFARSRPKKDRFQGLDAVLQAEARRADRLDAEAAKAGRAVSYPEAEEEDLDLPVDDDVEDPDYPNGRSDGLDTLSDEDDTDDFDEASDGDDER